jgi:uncharacterized membrane protein YfcA
VLTLVNIFVLFIAGLIGGTAAGLFGIGGGVIYVLVYNVFLVEMLGGIAGDAIVVQLTILNAACSILFAALIGSWRQYKRGKFHADKVLALGLTSAVTAYFTTRIIAGWQGYDQQVFLVVFTVALAPLIMKFIPRSSRKINHDLPRIMFPATGIFTGTGSALSGLGGGFISNPVLHGLFGYPLKKTFSISLGSMIFTTLGIIIYHMTGSTQEFSEIPAPHLNGIIYSLILPVIAGVAVGTPFGIRLHHYFTARSLSWLFLLLALLIIIRNLVIILS